MAKKRRNWYPDGVAGSRACKVAFTGPEGIRHSVEVSAESVYEAAAAAVRLFRENGFLVVEAGPATVLEVTVLEPRVSHAVRVDGLYRWLASSGRTPREQALKAKLRQMVAAASGGPTL